MLVRNVGPAEPGTLECVPNGESFSTRTHRRVMLRSLFLLINSRKSAFLAGLVVATCTSLRASRTRRCWCWATATTLAVGVCDEANLLTASKSSERTLPLILSNFSGQSLQTWVGLSWAGLGRMVKPVAPHWVWCGAGVLRFAVTGPNLVMSD